MNYNKTRKTLFALLIFTFLFGFSQSNYYYYYKGKRLYFNLETSFLHITTLKDSLNLNIPNIKPFKLYDENVSVNGQKYNCYGRYCKKI